MALVYDFCSCCFWVRPVEQSSNQGKLQRVRFKDDSAGASAVHSGLKRQGSLLTGRVKHLGIHANFFGSCSGNSFAQSKVLKSKLVALGRRWLRWRLRKPM